MKERHEVKPKAVIAKSTIKQKLHGGWTTVKQSKLSRDFARIIPLLAIIGFTVVPDTSRGVVLFSLGILVVMAGLSHILRKILFPYISMEDAWTKANETPQGAAIVFASICFVMATAMIGGLLLLK